MTGLKKDAAGRKVLLVASLFVIEKYSVKP